jgi:hypothetical protein
MELNNIEKYQEQLTYFLNMKNEQIASYKNMLHGFQVYKIDGISSLRFLLKKSIEANKQLKQKNKTYSILFNPLFYWGIHETTNSRMLADLFSPKGNHGQEDLFLNLFLKHVGIETDKNDEWEIYTEYSNVDILLRTSNGKKLIIVENKINGADDRPNQLYRYYNEFLLPKKVLNKKTHRVIYLTRHRNKTYSAQSIISKDGKSCVPVHLISNITFDNDIKGILLDAQKDIPNENQRLKIFIEFFIEQTTK